MIVLDTHAIVWWLQGNKKLSRTAKRAIDKAPRRGVAAVSLWEIARLVEQGRIKFDIDVEDWLDELLLQDGVHLLPLTAAVSVRATRLGAFHGDPADRLIVATALVHGASLVTADAAIQDSGVVTTIW